MVIAFTIQGQRVFRHSDDTRVDDPLSGRRLEILGSTLWSDLPDCAGVTQKSELRAHQMLGNCGVVV